jgi:hypothetical protein
MDSSTLVQPEFIETICLEAYIGAAVPDFPWPQPSLLLILITVENLLEGTALGLLRCIGGSMWWQVSIQYIGITIDVFQKWNIVEKEIFTVLLGGV